MRTLIAVICLLTSLLPSTVSAGGRGGHSTTFDANLFPGYTIKNFISDYSATCNGVADDSSALASWLAAGVAQNPGKILLYIPPGSRCRFVTTSGFIWDGTLGGPGIQNAIVWAYGATASTASMQAESAYQDNLHSSRIVSASAGATTLTLITAAENSRYAVGSWICIAGISLQASGLPANFQLFEYRLITAINAGAGTITINKPLTYSYLSTWPLINAGSGSTPDYGGPASIFLMPPSWNTNSAIFGLTVPGPNGVNSIGRTLQHTDVSFHGLGIAPSVGENINYSYSWLGTQIEVDKNISNLTFYRTAAYQLLTFSANDNMNIISSAFTTGINGTSKNVVINDTKSTAIYLGPIGFGHGVAAALDGTVVTSSTPGGQSIATSLLTFSSGTFSIAKASGSVDQFYAWAVPSQKYFFAFYDGSIHRCTPDTIFTISAITQDVTNNFAATDLGSSLPTPTCDGQPPNRYFAYPAATIKQINSPAGSANLTQYAAP